MTCPSAAADLGLRSEHISLNEEATWCGKVSLVEPTGADTYTVVQTAAGAITVRCSPDTEVRVGDNVGLYIFADKVNWFDKTSGVRLG